MDLTSETIASLTTKHYHHSILASKVLAAYHQKRLPRKFSQNVQLLLSQETKSKGLITKRIGKLVELHTERIDSAIDNERDYLLDYFGLKTLMKSYLLKFNGQLLETPQYLFMRVSLGIHDDDIDAALETYELMSKKYFIHASPTLFYSGTEIPSLSSCFLVAMKDDSIDGIFKTVHQTALISKCAGGVGLHVSNIRASGSYISGTNGMSSGLVPMLRVFNATAKYVDQGGNKRPGAFCIYLEPWHADIFEFLELRKNHGKEEVKARDLFYALWISDLFMEKVQKAEDWCLFSQDSCPGLTDTYGAEFVKLYNKYEAEGKYVRKVSAQKLWHAILVAQTETGNPFLLYKDACNEKSNQKNLGTIKSSNLCCEIVEYSDDKETAVCNLASVSLSMFVNSGSGTYDFNSLHKSLKQKA
ncbi:unnamed protein product [Ambrosiozyma monospora]|uniref:Unnamed protein product n=1 Tax=Ambrosiozyma monospora TaxID=43982 RepID=A0ACB5TWE6_AMBMO|nr:unnamed protein product [Ambrosiozyma monospora]